MPSIHGRKGHEGALIGPALLAIGSIAALGLGFLLVSFLVALPPQCDAGRCTAQEPALGEIAAVGLMIIAGTVGLVGSVLGVRYLRTGEGGRPSRITWTTGVAIALLAVVVLAATAS